MKKNSFSILLLFVSFIAFAQAPVAPPGFMEIKKLAATPVKNQQMTGTCWCFSTVSLLESETLRKEKKEFDLSEMFIVRNVYIEKAKNYVLRLGKTQFGEGGLGHDMIQSVAKYGAVPEMLYSGLKKGQKEYNHTELVAKLKEYLDTVIAHTPIRANWLEGYEKILNSYMGVAPREFALDKLGYPNVGFTPETFAKEVLHFRAIDYINLTSFTHEPYYKSFVLQVPDNFANGSYNNLPLEELITVVKNAINSGYTVLWDADVSNNGFMQDAGLALNLDPNKSYSKNDVNADMKELPYNASSRQAGYENLTTQDDHLMHIVGIEKSKSGKTFFIVKNSWGETGPFKGYIHVSEAYFAMNTISIVLPRETLPKAMLSKFVLNNQ